MADRLTRELVARVEQRCIMAKGLPAMKALLMEDVSSKAAAAWMAEGFSLIEKGRQWDAARCRTPDCSGLLDLDHDDRGERGRSQVERASARNEAPECPECGARQWVLPTIREECVIRLARIDSRGSTELLGKAFRTVDQVLDLPMAGALPAQIGHQLKASELVLKLLDPRFTEKREVHHSGSVQLTAGPAYTHALSDDQIERLSPQTLSALQSIAAMQAHLDQEARKLIEADLAGERYEPVLPFAALPALDTSRFE